MLLASLQQAFRLQLMAAVDGAECRYLADTLYAAKNSTGGAALANSAPFPITPLPTKLAYRQFLAGPRAAWPHLRRAMSDPL